MLKSSLFLIALKAHVENIFDTKYGKRILFHFDIYAEEYKWLDKYISTRMEETLIELKYKIRYLTVK